MRTLTRTNENEEAEPQPEGEYVGGQDSVVEDGQLSYSAIMALGN